MKKLFAFLALVVAFAVITTACSQDGNDPMEQTIMAHRVAEPSIVLSVMDTTEISIKCAERIATNFSTLEIGDASRSSQPKAVSIIHSISDSLGQPLMYIANFDNDKGFIVVSASKTISPILAVVENGSYNPDAKISEGFSEWLDFAKDWVMQSRTYPSDSILKHNSEWQELLPTTRSINLQSRSNSDEYIASEILKWQQEGWTVYKLSDWISQNPNELRDAINNIPDENSFAGRPMKEDTYVLQKVDIEKNTRTQFIKTKWGQDSPYNEYMPYDLPVNCGAVAVGQILKTNADISGYDFASMPNAITTSCPAIASFLYDISVNIGVDFRTGLVGLTGIYNGLSTHYSYASEFSSGLNNDAIKISLLNNRPVILLGYVSNKDNALGHIWLACGIYDNERTVYTRLMVPIGQPEDASGAYAYGYFNTEYISSTKIYMNWGNAGKEDGYYDFGDASTDGQNFAYRRACLYNIRKQYGGN